MTSFVVSVVSVISVVSVGCSSSDDKTPNNGSSASSSSGASTTNGGSGGLPSGVTRVACYKAASKKCTMHGESSQSGIASQRASCTSDSGVADDHCPAAGLVGCCVIAGLGECSYDAAAASSLMSGCGAGGTQFTTSAP